MKLQQPTVEMRVIRFLIGSRSLPFCVECVSKVAWVSFSDAKAAVSGLDGSRGFEQQSGRCVRCLRPDWVVCAIPPVTGCADGMGPRTWMPEREE
jgi:hypothetical protein